MPPPCVGWVTSAVARWRGQTSSPNSSTMSWNLGLRGFCAFFTPVIHRGSNPDVYVTWRGEFRAAMDIRWCQQWFGSLAAPVPTRHVSSEFRVTSRSFEDMDGMGTHLVGRARKDMRLGPIRSKIQQCQAFFTPFRPSRLPQKGGSADCSIDISRPSTSLTYPV